MPKTRHRRLAKGLALLALGMVVVSTLAWLTPSYSTYRTFARPDGLFTIGVLSQERLWPQVMPGQGGDGSGVVRLYDADGVVLEEARVELVNTVDRVRWQEGRVEVAFVAAWELPRPRRMPARSRR